MYCYIHHERDAIGTCTNCSRPICQECAVEVQGRLICRNCLAIRPSTLAGEKDPNTAFLLELVGGLFGLLGLGYLYVGKTSDGIIRLIVWMLYSGAAYFIISLLVAAYFIGCICLPFQLAIHVGVSIWSANDLKNKMLKKQI